MNILVVMDTYVPSRISAALLMRDFVRALRDMGHTPVVLVPGEGLGVPVVVGVIDGTPVIRASAPRTKDIGKIRRALAEWWLPHALWRGLRRSGFSQHRWDGVVWYSPTIFLAPLVRRLSQRDGCRAYLIVRDLFPDWALDAGVLRDGPVYRYFKRVERGQYATADVIGVQTRSNLPLVARDSPSGASIEVLSNWMALPPLVTTAIDLSQGPLARRIIFAYTGNMGAAQGMNALMDLSVSLRDREDIGFLFVGRGTDLPVLQLKAAALALTNVQFIDEIDSQEIPGLLAQCHVGLISLDPRHRTHNIPGKLITYLHAGLPVLAWINPGNDLQGLIQDEDIGFVVSGDCPAALRRHALTLAEDAQIRVRQGAKGREVALRCFSPVAAATQVVQGLQPVG